MSTSSPTPLEEEEPSETSAEETKDARSDGDAPLPEKENQAASEEAVLPKGNPLRKWRGGVTLGVGGMLAFLLMAHNGQLRYAVPIGLLALMVAALGAMDLAGTFDDPEEHVMHRLTLRSLVSPLASVVAAGLLVCVCLMGGQSGWGNQWLWGIGLTGTFVALVGAVFQLGVALGPWRTDELGDERPLLRRHGFWLCVIASALYLPALGLYSLWDPWETHYGEVAREMLARDDWISLWWAQDGWFWSKPILNFWIQGLAMSALGTHYQPDQMLVGAGAGAHPEWVVRFPNFLLTLMGMFLLYKGVARVFGRRTGLMAGAALATMPDWFFLAHQTMTDMPFVAPMTGAMGLVILGMASDPEERVKLYALEAPRKHIAMLGFGVLGIYLAGFLGGVLGAPMAIAGLIVGIAGVGFAASGSASFLKGKIELRLSLWHLVFGAILVCALPQLLYLLSRNIELVLHGDGPKGFRLHWDEFRSGSGMGNCGLPGNEACNLTHPASIPRAAGANPANFGLALLRLFGGFEPILQFLLWSGVLVGLIYINWGERRVQRLLYLAAWFFAALATMGKGPAGFVLPIACTFFFIAARRRWSEILRFEVVSGLLVIGCVAIPWFVAMYVRHGSPFTDRLIFHDMFNRAFHHVHDTNEGDDTSFRFYIWQLGYALFPWTGIAPLALLWWARRGNADEAQARMTRTDTSVLLVMWFMTAFTLFSFMGTKFHHYIFPAVPAAGALVGILLGEMVGDRPLTRHSPAWSQLALYAGLSTVAVVALTGYFGGSVMGLEPHWTGVDKWALGIGLALMATPIAARFLGLRAEPEAAAVMTKADKIEVHNPYRGGTVVATGPDPEAERRSSHEDMMFAAGAIAAAIVIGVVGRDLSMKINEGGDQPGAIRLLHLFTYNYRRPWPDHIDFHFVLAAFAIPAVALTVVLAARALRRHAVLAMCAFAAVWAVWTLDVYMVETAPHWGQHEVMQAYYDTRTGPNEPLIAYQMNWKGENFYTSNKIPAFVSSGANFTNWIKQQKEQKGVKVMFFVTEHSRTGGLRSEVGAKSYKEITDRKICNKFVLVRAEL